MEDFKALIWMRQPTKVLTPMDRLNETLKMLKKKERTYEKLASRELRGAEKWTRAGRPIAASLCLAMKGLYEEQIERFEKLRFRIKKLMLELEEVQATTEGMHALSTARAAMQGWLEAINIDDCEGTVNGIEELMARLRQFQDSLLTPPVAAAADFDEDELEGLCERVEQLRRPATTAPAAPGHVAVDPRPARPVRQGTAKEDIPADMQAEMAP